MFEVFNEMSGLTCAGKGWGWVSEWMSETLFISSNDDNNNEIIFYLFFQIRPNIREHSFERQPKTLHCLMIPRKTP